MRVISVCVDLMDRSRIDAGHTDVQFVRTVLDAIQRVGLGDVDRVLVDLSRSSDSEQLRALVATGVHVVAYGPHVDDSLFATARGAGCHEVLPRSRFFHQIASLNGKD